MDEPDVMIDVQLVVMLALTLPHGHIEMLQKVVALIQNQDVVKSIVHSSNQKEIYEKNICCRRKKEWKKY